MDVQVASHPQQACSTDRSLYVGSLRVTCFSHNGASFVGKGKDVDDRNNF